MKLTITIEKLENDPYFIQVLMKIYNDKRRIAYLR